MYGNILHARLSKFVDVHHDKNAMAEWTMQTESVSSVRRRRHARPTQTRLLCPAPYLFIYVYCIAFFVASVVVISCIVVVHGSRAPAASISICAAYIAGHRCCFQIRKLRANKSGFNFIQYKGYVLCINKRDVRISAPLFPRCPPVPVHFFMSIYYLISVLCHFQM